MNASEENNDRLRDEAQMLLAETLIAALTPVAAKTGETIYKHLRAPNPISVDVLDSTLEHGKHVITFGIMNNTRHGAYLESISLLEPNEAFEVRRRTSMDFGDGRSEDWSPVLLNSNPGDYARFILTFPQCQNRGIDSDWSGSIEVLVSRLDATKPEPQKVKFRLRW